MSAVKMVNDQTMSVVLREIRSLAERHEPFPAGSAIGELLGGLSHQTVTKILRALVERKDFVLHRKGGRLMAEFADGASTDWTTTERDASANAVENVAKRLLSHITALQGEAMPGDRGLQSLLSCGKSTVSKAYELLISRGLIESKIMGWGRSVRIPGGPWSTNPQAGGGRFHRKTPAAASDYRIPRATIAADAPRLSRDMSDDEIRATIEAAISSGKIAPARISQADTVAYNAAALSKAPSRFFDFRAA